MARSTPLQVYTVLKAEAKKHGDDSVFGPIEGTSIVLRESGGDSNARRDASKNPGGGNDRGWWQFNDKYFPDVSDAIAYDPVLSTAKAYEVSKGFTDWKPWTNTANPTPRAGANWQLALKAYSESIGSPVLAGGAAGVADDGWIDVIVDSAGNVLEDAADKVIPDIPWAAGLGRLLSYLISGEFWKRLGIGTLGLGIIVIGLLLMFGKSAVQTVGEVK